MIAPDSRSSDTRFRACRSVGQRVKGGMHRVRTVFNPRGGGSSKKCTLKAGNATHLVPAEPGLNRHRGGILVGVDPFDVHLCRRGAEAGEAEGQVRAVVWCHAIRSRGADQLVFGVAVGVEGGLDGLCGLGGDFTRGFHLRYPLPGLCVHV